MMNRAYLSLGSNIDPEENIKAALHLLAGRSKLVAVSTFWETEPVGLQDQANFLNGAAIIETDLSAATLKETVLSRIEQELGRKRTSNKNAPRTIDLDIILFNQEVLEYDGRHIPSPEVLERAFVAIPLAELAPDYIHPLTGQTLAELAAAFAHFACKMRKRDDLTPFLSISKGDSEYVEGIRPDHR
jgi:2-amino-4-hydroxy-6-hydroxymethyldihydropteridine diphosphokinase